MSKGININILYLPCMYWSRVSIMLLACGFLTSSPRIDLW
jgi:hypothetical protein